MDTRQALIDSASELVRTRGYSGFSYADLSERVGIRKASIHHHFPAKEDLGLALIQQYTAEFDLLLGQIDRDRSDAADKIHDYISLYRQSLLRDCGCLCGMLAFEVDVVPMTVAGGAQQFMDHNLKWLTAVLAAGQQQQIHRQTSPQDLAVCVLAVCQGALLVARATRNNASFDRATQSVFASQFPPGQLLTLKPTN